MKFFVTCFKCLSPIVYPKGKGSPLSIVFTLPQLSGFLLAFLAGVGADSCIIVLLVECKQVKGVSGPGLLLGCCVAGQPVVLMLQLLTAQLN